MEEIHQLKRDGLSIQAISNLTGYDRKTIRKYLLTPMGRPEYSPRPKPTGKLEPFKAYLGERLQAGVWNARVLFRELRSRNYTGGYTLLTDWLRPQRAAARVIAVRRFETPPGKQAQVDWGHLGSLTEAGDEQALWGFTMTLGLQPADDGRSRQESETGDLATHARSRLPGNGRRPRRDSLRSNEDHLDWDR